MRRVASKGVFVSVLLSAAGCAGGRPAVTPAPTPRPSAPQAAGSRLQRLPALSRVILHVKDRYVDPSRIDPRRMVVAALESVAGLVDGLTVSPDDRTGRLTLAVAGSTLELDLAQVDSDWKVRTELGRAMAFLEPSLGPTIDRRAVEYAAVRGLLSTLDANTVLVKPELARELHLQQRGELGGVGLVLAIREGRLTVVHVIRGSPGEQAGLAADDVLTEIDGRSTVGLGLPEAVELLRGKPETRVRLAWRRGDASRSATVTRRVVHVEQVTDARLLADGIGYARLARFYASATRELRDALRALRAQAGGALRGLVLDLRGNQGGLLDQGVEVADLFLGSGEIVSIQGAQVGGAFRNDRSATPSRDDLLDVPLAVLVDGRSAAASEIVAAALRDNDRAVVLGQRTRGAGTVQTIVDFADEGENVVVKLTVAAFRTPRGEAIEGQGVAPDVALGPAVSGAEPAPTDDVTRFAHDVLARVTTGARAELVSVAASLARERPARE